MKKEKRKAKNTHGTTQKEKNMYYRSNTSDIYLVQNACKRKINNSVATLLEFGGTSIFSHISNTISPRNITVSYPDGYT